MREASLSGGRPGRLIEHARATRGFMPDEEGLVLSRLAYLAASSPGPPPLLVEVGAYCGRSSLYLAAGLAAGGAGGLLLSVDHHHGSEENQAGWEHHDPTLVDPATGQMDTLPHWRAAIEQAGAGDLVVAVVGDSPSVARHLRGPFDLVFIDGGHGAEPAWADYRGWAPGVAPGAFLAIHDVFPDPRQGGRPPYELYRRALECGAFVEESSLGCGSLRVLRRVGEGI